MIELRLEQVQLQAAPRSKEEAIRSVGQLLVASGHIAPPYIESMLERETVANTYLGNGIAIPHGLPQHRDFIHETGIAVLQIPEGVTWNAGETVYLAVGIAAKSDEHIDVLRRLTRVLGNEAQVQRLIRTHDPADIIETLTGERPPAPAPAETLTDYEHYFDIVVTNKTGLHARPATHLVTLAKDFDAEIRVRHGSEIANGKSLISLLQLGIERGTQIRVSAQGPQAEAALAALKTAIEAGLGDEEEPAAPPPAKAATLSWTPTAVSATLEGVPASPGLGVGPLWKYSRREITVEDRPRERITEAEAFQAALDASKAELEKVYEEVKVRLGSSKASIFRAHAEFLEDADMLQQVVSLIFQGHSAAWSWKKVIDERVDRMKKLDDPVLAGRAVDLSDVGQRVLYHLLGVNTADNLMPTSPFILIADDLAPSDTASLDPDLVLGFCTAGGGPTSHSAIMARSMGIPAVVGIGSQLLTLPNDTAAIIDGYSGKLYLNPSARDMQSAREAQQAQRIQEEAANAARFEPALTTDGYRVEIAANINRSNAVPQAIEAGAEGVGLMRTEFLFLERDTAPTEDEQYETYRAMAEALGGRPLIIRTLDIGGDKAIPYLDLPKEENPFLGVRGIRLCLVHPELFRPQLRAIYRAAAHGNIKIMFPMIATLEDLQRARAIAEEVRQELNAPHVEIGIMVEVPSAAAMADQFAVEVDFFSIGTNDLTQYTLAMDRGHPLLAKQADALHPAVLRLIDMTVRAADKAGKWVGVCGGLASEPKGSVLLVGLGVKELSVSVPDIPAVKAQVRRFSHTEMQALAQRALQCHNAAEVRALL